MLKFNPNFWMASMPKIASWFKFSQTKTLCFIFRPKTFNSKLQVPNVPNLVFAALFRVPKCESNFGLFFNFWNNPFEITLTSAPVSYNHLPSTPSKRIDKNGLFELLLLIAQISKFSTFLFEKLFEQFDSFKRIEVWGWERSLPLEAVGPRRSLNKRC